MSRASGDGGIRVRDYSPADRAACLAVFESNVHGSFLPSERAEFETFLNELPGPYFVLVEPMSGRIVACGGYAISPGSTTADLCWGMVERGRQGLGLGRMLTEIRLQRVRKDSDATAVALRTSQQTRGIYERLGFSCDRTVPDGIAPGMDTCEMSMSIVR